MKEMGNLAHDRCYGTDKTTQKSGYGELTRLRKVSPTGSAPTKDVPNASAFLLVLFLSLRKSFPRHPISSLTCREKKEKIVGKG